MCVGYPRIFVPVCCNRASCFYATAAVAGYRCRGEIETTGVHSSRQTDTDTSREVRCDQYYVSHQHWLLPFCLLCTKLLLAQSFKLLAASASLTSSGWQLLTSLEEMQASRFNSK